MCDYVPQILFFFTSKKMFLKLMIASKWNYRKSHFAQKNKAANPLTAISAISCRVLWCQSNSVYEKGNTSILMLDDCACAQTWRYSYSPVTVVAEDNWHSFPYSCCLNISKNHLTPFHHHFVSSLEFCLHYTLKHKSNSTPRGIWLTC